MKFSPSSSSRLGLAVVAIAYVALDYWRERAQWLSPSYSELIQPGLWGSLTILALFEAPSYKHWGLEIRALPKFLWALTFVVAMLFTEVVMVHWVTAVLGLDWHASTDPLPDPGQWLLLFLNERLPPPLVALLRARLLELHHFLMLFVLLAFSVLFNCIPAPGLGLAARYCVAMGIGRLLRFATFCSTVLPSPRPWCAAHRFWGTPPYPHPWAQKYFTPYAQNEEMIREILRRDECFAPVPHYPAEYVPTTWGIWSFLATLLRPPDPLGYAGSAGDDKLFGVVRPGGGCNDLAFSGHMVVAVLTACAWQEVNPGWLSWLLWLLTFHSAQREIRERQHYSVDVVVALYAGFFIWHFTAFVHRFPLRIRKTPPTNITSSSKNPSLDSQGQGNTQVEKPLLDRLRKATKDGDLDQVKDIGHLLLDRLREAAKEGDLEEIREILETDEVKKGVVQEGKGQAALPLWIIGVGVILVCSWIAIILFKVMVGG
eukprot:TRINITY_DN26387_c0_g1_i1.p1 TRINITY_DN26387_c0_g1~~TRINITY_DN26387_c0_g1_i1.p1  ORF type:complete len:486 (+),score=60.20 TRINITY_DN26387_c0_g1_i1:276-1733(+)